jgi:hypothetical protein
LEQRICNLSLQALLFIKILTPEKSFGNSVFKILFFGFRQI